jgi:hypothetical protein
MTLQARRKRLGGDQQAQHVTQLGHVFAPPFGSADIAAELPGMNRRPH